MIGEVRFGNLTKSKSSRDGSLFTRKWVVAWTHWYRRDSVEKSSSWESAVFGGGGGENLTKRKAGGAMCGKLSTGT